MHGVMVLLTLTTAPEGPVVGPGRPAPAARRDAVLAWNEVALTAIRAERTPPPMAARHPHWPELTPFAVERAVAFRPPPPPELTSEEYTQALNEVISLGRRTGGARTEEQTVIARFWDDGAGTATPPGHWNQLARVVA